jgi:hypothetical protein
MPADPRDDFGVLEGSEHLLFGLEDPYAVIRREVVSYLTLQAPDTVVDKIAAYGDSKWLTVNRRDGNELVVTGFAMCVRARIASSVGYAAEESDAAITLLCCRWDEPEHALVRAFVDLGTAADLGYTDEAIQTRLFAFRTEVAGDENLL